MPRNPCKDLPVSWIRFLVDRMHVAESDDAVANEVARRLPRGTDKAFARRFRRCAVKIHHENQGIYRFAMGGQRWRRGR